MMRMSGRGPRRAEEVSSRSDGTGGPTNGMPAWRALFCTLPSRVTSTTGVRGRSRKTSRVAAMSRRTSEESSSASRASNCDAIAVCAASHAESTLARQLRWLRSAISRSVSLARSTLFLVPDGAPRTRVASERPRQAAPSGSQRSRHGEPETPKPSPAVFGGDSTSPRTANCRDGVGSPATGGFEGRRGYYGPTA
jgi:hypothetical protein